MALGSDNKDLIDKAMQEDTEAEESSIKPASDLDYYTPIKALSTFIYDWRIKARLIRKGPRKTWKNARSEGYFMNIELMDCYGSMI